jgi:hypothetical protein
MRASAPQLRYSATREVIQHDVTITFCTGASVFLNKSMFNSSNFAREIVSFKSEPPQKASISMVSWCDVDRDRFARSASFLSFWTAFLSFEQSCPCRKFST